MRSFRLVFLATGGFAIFLGVVSLVASFFYAPVTTFRVLGVLLIVVGLAEMRWGPKLLMPGGLKADASGVCLSFMPRQRMDRADLAEIYRGMAFVPGQKGSGKAYLFVRRDRTVAMTISSTWFRESDMEAFAARLGVPIRGDYRLFPGDHVPPN